MSASIVIGTVEFAEPTILILGNSQGFSWLQNLLRHHQQVDLAQCTEVKLANLTMQILPTDTEDRLVELEKSGGIRCFQWNISHNRASVFADSLAELVRHTEGHQYLDTECQNDMWQITASIGEYEAHELWPSIRTAP